MLSENRKTLGLATPMIANHLGQMAINWADTLMVAKLGVLPLAACAFANVVVHACLMFGFGMITSVSICAAQAYGAKRPKEAGEFLFSGTVLGLLVGLFLAMLIYLGLPYVHLLGQEEAVIREGRSFLILVGWSIVPVMVGTVGKAYCESLSRPWLPFWIMMGGVILNIILNWMLIFGRAGFPALGLEGAGWATLIARSAIAVALYAVIFAKPAYADFRVLTIPLKRLGAQLATLFKVGWPISFHLLSEVGLFCGATLMMGWVSIEGLAAHQVALNCAATAFMVPLGIGLAVTVRVGQAIGAGEYTRVRPIAFGALGMGGLMMGASALLFLIGGNWLGTFFFPDKANVAHLTATFLFVAGLFGIFDALQVIGLGGLRGLADVRMPVIYVFVAYWGIGLPASYYFAFARGFDGLGIWYGILIGLLGASIAIVARLWNLSARKPSEMKEAMLA